RGAAGRRAAGTGGAPDLRPQPAGRHAADDLGQVRGGGQVAADRPPQRRPVFLPLRPGGQAHRLRRPGRGRRLRGAVGPRRGRGRGGGGGGGGGGRLGGGGPRRPPRRCRRGWGRPPTPPSSGRPARTWCATRPSATRTATPAAAASAR